MICKIYYSNTDPNLYVLLEINFTIDDYINSNQHQKDFIISKIFLRYYHIISPIFDFIIFFV